MSTRRTTQARSRGIAMLLVIIALGAATVMTTGYLLSRRNSAAIGQNAADAIAARWASRAAAEHALAVLQTASDWRTPSLDGRLFDGRIFAGAQTTVLVTDLDGNAITGNESAVVLTAVGQINNFSAATQWIINTQPAPTVEKTLSPMMDEFSIFAVSKLDIEPGATVAIWDLSPLSRLRPPLNIGIDSPKLLDFNVSNSSQLANPLIFLPPNAYSSLISSAMNKRQVAGAQVLQTVYPHASASQSFSNTLPKLTIRAKDLDGNKSVLVASGSYDKTEVLNGATITLRESQGRFYAFKDLLLDRKASMKIEGNIVVEITQDLELVDRSSIELLTPDSSVTFLIGDDFIVEDSTVGLPQAIARDRARDVMQLTNYIDTSAIQIISQIPANSGISQKIKITDNSIVVAAIHSPTAKAKLKKNADLIGRLSAKEVSIRSGSTLLYDPGLNPRLGVTNTSGPLYDATGTFKPIFKTALESYDPSVGYELLPSYISSSVGNFDAALQGNSLGAINVGNITPRYSYIAWRDTWPTDLFALESRALNTINTIDGVYIQPAINIADLFTTTTSVTVTQPTRTVSGGTRQSLPTMTFVNQNTAPF